MSNVWIGILIQVAVGILTGLSIAPIRRLWWRRGKTRAEAKREAAESEYFLALYYHANPELFTQFMITSAVDAAQAYFFLVLSVLLTAIIVVGLRDTYFVDSRVAWFTKFIFALGFVGMVRAGFLLGRFSKAVLMYSQQFAFPLYLNEEVPADIRDLRLEHEAQERRKMWMPVDAATLNESKRIN